LPQITVSLPIYNADRFLAECIESIKAQTFEDFEVIAVLDGCTDRSEEILMDLKDQRFVVVKNERNEGVVSASNLTIARATGPYTGRVDADDLIDPTRFEKQIEYLGLVQDVDVLGTWFDYIDERGQSIREPFPFAVDHDEIKAAFRRFNSIGGSTVLCRVNRLRAVGGFTDQAPYAEDLTLWLKCLAAGFRFANLPEILTHYRQHPGQLSRRRNAETNRMANLAYRTYGPLIWGEDAPDIEFGASMGRRIVRRVQRMLGLRK
jgi:glycosyltransferase involved in cell wall biosynthesis